MPVDIQQLRCKVNFQALAFVPHINALGETLVRRLRSPPSKTEHLANEYLRETTEENVNRGNGKFVVLHLRFDKVSVFFWHYSISFLGINQCPELVRTMIRSGEENLEGMRCYMFPSICKT